MTYTYTTYFSEDSIAGLRAELAALDANVEKRRPYIDEHAYAAMKLRLAVIEAGMLLLLEPVPRPFGG